MTTKIDRSDETREADRQRGFSPMGEDYKRRMREEYDEEALRIAADSAVLSGEARKYARKILAERGLVY